MKESSWEVYLLRRDSVDALREKGKFLRTMEHNDIVKLKALGPIVVEAPAIYRAKTVFYSILSAQSWFPKGDKNMYFVRLLPYIYAKNKIDRRIHKDPDWEGLYTKVEEHEGEEVAR